MLDGLFQRLLVYKSYQLHDLLYYCEGRLFLRIGVKVQLHMVSYLASSRRELVANCVHTTDADATQLDSFVASVCIGHNVRRRSVLHLRPCLQRRRRQDG